MTTVLVVDDDRGVRESLRMALDDEFEVTTAASAEEALERIGRSRPQTMVLDQNMPGMSGLGLLEALGTGAVPGTVVISGEMDVELARQALHLGADDLMPKPCDVAQLKRSLRESLNKTRKPQEGGQPLALRAAYAHSDGLAREGTLAMRSRWFGRTLVAEALSESHGNLRMAARKLGVTVLELKRYGMSLL